MTQSMTGGSGGTGDNGGDGNTGGDNNYTQDIPQAEENQENNLFALAEDSDERGDDDEYPGHTPWQDP